MHSSAEDNEFSSNYSRVLKRIESAALSVDRDPSEIKLVAVSKMHPAELVRDAISADVVVFGENKVQEAEGKIEILGRDSAEWHLIGHLQSNKAKKAVQLFDVIQTVDSKKLAARLERLCEEENRERLSVFVQVDLADEAAKFGILRKDLPELVEFLKNCTRLSFDGLMIIPPFFENAEDVRPYFRKLRTLRDELQNENAFAGSKGELSMGMSHDFEIAIEEGATIIRVGTALFGERDYSR